MKSIDLRSDTVTQPSPAMRKAMYEAELGDDVFEEDPTINRLQEVAAARLGKEAGLFVASGSMGNLISALTHCPRGTQAILGNQSHIFQHEQGGLAMVGGIHSRTIANLPDGRLDVQEIERNIDPEDVHYPRTSLICLENTWNGIPLRSDYTAQVAEIAKRHQLKMHLDGARLFNAAVALKQPVAALARDFDSVSFCLSKGLSAPVGSIVCGTTQFIKEARRNRKLVGGGMRQAGVLAAAGLIALDAMVERLSEDHENAKLLARGLAEIPGVELDAHTAQTNIVFFSVAKTNKSVDAVACELEREGVRVMNCGTKLRAVTHYGITREDIERALQVFRTVLGSGVKPVVVPVTV